MHALYIMCLQGRDAAALADEDAARRGRQDLPGRSADDDADNDNNNNNNNGNKR